MRKFLRELSSLTGIFHGKLVHEFFITRWGCLQVRFEPTEFLRDLKEIGRLIDDRKEKEAREKLDRAHSKWGTDPELIRADTLNSFLNEDRVLCRCGDGSCMECDDNGMKPI